MERSGWLDAVAPQVVQVEGSELVGDLIPTRVGDVVDMRADRPRPPPLPSTLRRRPPQPAAAPSGARRSGRRGGALHGSLRGRAAPSKLVAPEVPRLASRSPYAFRTTRRATPCAGKPRDPLGERRHRRS